jgi:hypothetical protein
LAARRCTRFPSPVTKTQRVNAWSDRPVVDAKLVEAAWHPFGESHFDEAIDQAKKTCPKETKALLRTLDQWRSKLSGAILQWA